MTQLDALTAISPLDGRYRSKITQLENYFSEYALIQYRFKVEALYLKALIENKIGQAAQFPADKTGLIPADKTGLIDEWVKNFSKADAEWVKQKESVIQHDVKAVEYLLKDKLEKAGLGEFKELVHFGLTSQDINNTAVPMSLKDFHIEVFFPLIEEVIEKLDAYSTAWKEIPMLAKTHGQPASPTKLGKEIQVFKYRLERQYESLKSLPVTGKFGGATGNFNAHHIAFPEVDWVNFGNRFLKESLSIERQQLTTQIESYDDMAAIFHNVTRINTVLTDSCRDFWTYISMEYFKQKINPNEVGSSAMPHKVNPIDFENAEGNLGLANAALLHLSAKLPISRLQRDLTDSTVLRNIGVPYGHSVIAMKAILKGLDKLKVNEVAIRADLEKNWLVVAEAIQTVLRRENYPNPYEALKNLTRKGEATGKAEIHAFIDGLDVSDEIKAELLKITPENYTGVHVF